MQQTVNHLVQGNGEPNKYDEDRESEATHKTAENYLTGTIKQMILYFSNDDYEKFIL